MSEYVDFILTEDDDEYYECWYCFDMGTYELVFSYEFDTYVHMGCIQERLDNGETDSELLILAREFGLEKK